MFEMFKWVGTNILTYNDKCDFSDDVCNSCLRCDRSAVRQKSRLLAYRRRLRI